MRVPPILGTLGSACRTTLLDESQQFSPPLRRTLASVSGRKWTNQTDCCDSGLGEKRLLIQISQLAVPKRGNSSEPKRRINPLIQDGCVQVNGVDFPADDWTNLSPSVFNKIGANLHCRKDHPIYLIRKKIENFFRQHQKDYLLHKDDSIQSVFDNLSPIVSTRQNFDSLLIPDDHVSRKNSESYYLNKSTMLRAHTSAHQVDGAKTAEKQEAHTEESAKLIELHLKGTLTGLAHYLFGKEIEFRWVDAYFPFTHPSWEMEIFFGGKWMEVLGCGVVEQKIICDSGVTDRAGWAFGLGLERLAMILYKIPDIRLFWTSDSGFTHQFEGKNPEDVVEFVPFSKAPQCINDLSFWLPDDVESFDSNDFYDLARTIDSDDLLEQIKLIDVFEHPKTRRTSHCYRIVYRHATRPLKQETVNEVHAEISEAAESRLGVEVRNKK